MLDTIHPKLEAPDLDGIIVLLTLPQTTCVTVVAIEEGKIGEVPRLVENGDIGRAIANGSVIGAVKFAFGTDDVQNDSLAPVLAKWNEERLHKLPVPSLIAWHDGDADANVPEAIANSQGRSIQLDLPPPSEVQPPELVRSPRPLLPGCPVILFVPARGLD